MRHQSMTYMAVIIMVLSLTVMGCAPKPADQAKEVAATQDAGETVKDTGAGQPSSVGTAGQATQQAAAAGRDEMTGLANTIYFDFDESVIKTESVQVLDELIKFMKDNEGLNVQISGHCDERGTSEYNMALGDRRAKSGKDYFLEKGIDEKRISTISYGEEKPVQQINAEKI